MPVGFFFLLAETGSADLPHAFPDGRDAVQHAVIIAEGAGGVAAVGLAHRGKPAAEQAAAAAGRETARRADIQRAGREIRRPGYPLRMAGRHCLQAGDRAEHPVTAGLHGCLDLRENSQGDLLLAAAEGFLLREGSEKPEPVEGILLCDLHGLDILFFLVFRPFFRDRGIVRAGKKNTKMLQSG